MRILDHTDMNVILRQDIVDDKLEGLLRTKGMSTDAVVSYALYEVGKRTEGVLYWIRL